MPTSSLALAPLLAVLAGAAVSSTTAPPPPLSLPASAPASGPPATSPPAAASAAPGPALPRSRSPRRWSPQQVPSPRAGFGWPLAPHPAVVRPFLAPASAWGPGHRGVDLAADVGQPVLAVAEGQVTHVGVVAGRPTLTITHPGGLRTTYEPVGAAVRRGEHVAQGQLVGHLSGAPGHCAPAACLHLGALRGRTYLDPLSLLVRRAVRLLPHG